MVTPFRVLLSKHGSYRRRNQSGRKQLIEQLLPRLVLFFSRSNDPWKDEADQFVSALKSCASDLHTLVARNVKCAGDVEKRRKGIFLFNYFVGDDPQVTLALWDYLAGWYAVATGMNNSTLLLPLEGERSDYTIINHARWNGLVRFLWRQITKKSFRTYTQANLNENHVGSMPVFYHLA